MIEVKRLTGADPMRFDVTVRDGGSLSRHEVALAQKTWAKLTKKSRSPENCVEAAFGFLLDREPKEAILSRFDITVIGHYFPEFELQLPKYLGRVG